MSDTGDGSRIGLMAVGVGVALLVLGTILGLVSGNRDSGRSPALAHQGYEESDGRGDHDHSHGPDGPRTDEQIQAELSDPAHSGLPPGLAATLAEIGTQVVRADLTGKGRDAFPSYWGKGLYRPCCTNVKIHAAGARALSGPPDRVEVTVLWSAEQVDGGPPFTYQLTHVPFVQRDGHWVPVQPNDRR